MHQRARRLHGRLPGLAGDAPRGCRSGRRTCGGADQRALSGQRWTPVRLFDDTHVVDEILRVAEAGIWNPLVLLVAQRYELAGGGVDLGRDRV
jgi:hypothetical protein